MSSLRQQTFDRLAELKGPFIPRPTEDCPDAFQYSPFPISSSLSATEFRKGFLKYIERLGIEKTEEELDEKVKKLLEEDTVTNVITRESRNNFPETGEEQQIYFDTESKQAYLWNDDEYVKLSSGIDSDELVSIQCGDSKKNI